MLLARRSDNGRWSPVTGIVDPGEHPAATRSTSTTFRCRYVAGEARVADDESVAVGWFELDALPDMDPVLVERIITAVAHGGTTRLH